MENPVHKIKVLDPRNLNRKRMKDENQQQRTPVTYTEMMAQNQARIDKNLRESNIIIRDFHIKRNGVDSEMFTGNEWLHLWTSKNESDKKLCTVSFNPECHKELFPVYLGKRIRFHDKDSLGRDGLFNNTEFIIRSVISNDGDGLTLYMSKPNIIDRIFRRGKAQVYNI